MHILVERRILKKKTTKTLFIFKRVTVAHCGCRMCKCAAFSSHSVWSSVEKKIIIKKNTRPSWKQPSPPKWNPVCTLPVSGPLRVRRCVARQKREHAPTSVSLLWRREMWECGGRTQALLIHSWVKSISGFWPCRSSRRAWRWLCWCESSCTIMNALGCSFKNRAARWAALSILGKVND